MEGHKSIAKTGALNFKCWSIISLPGHLSISISSHAYPYLYLKYYAASAAADPDSDPDSELGALLVLGTHLVPFPAPGNFHM